MTSRILVCDGEQRTALAVVRSLGRAGYFPVVLGAADRTLAGSSRYAAASARCADPMTEPGRFLADVRAAAARFGSPLVLPVTEQSMLALTEAPGDGGLRVLGASGPAFRRASNKQLVLAAAPDVGLEVPRQLVVETPQVRMRDVLEAAPYPVAVKSIVSVSGGGRSQTAYAEDAHELEALLRALPAHRYPLLVQERVRGAAEGVFVLLQEGRLLASFAHRRIREYPPSGGRSVCAESIRQDPDLLARSVALLRHLGLEGPAMVEFKRDRRTGRPVLMEVNARLWGSLQLAIFAGVDFPRLMVDAALGKPLPDSPPAYRVGVRIRSLWGDLDYLLSFLAHGRRGLRLEPAGPGRFRTLLAFLTPHRQERLEFLSADDPRPFFTEGRSWFEEFGRSLTRRFRLFRRSKRPPALVLGTSITALGVLRVLRAAGRRAVHLPEGKSSIRFSRYYRAIPGARRGDAEGVTLGEFLRRSSLERAVLVPCSDDWLRRAGELELDMRERFPSFLPAPDVIGLMTDKTRFAELTTRLGVPHPRTWPVAGTDDLAEVPDAVLEAAFLKPRDSQAFFQRYRVKAFWVRSRAEAAERLEDLASTGLGVQLQEYIPGPPTAHYFLDGFADDTGRVRSILARQRLRMYPRDFGNSSSMRTVSLDEVRAAVESVERLVAETGYRGVFSVEFKRDGRDGLFKVLELNARPWWYVEFAARCGVDVCAWAYNAALALPPPATRPYRLGAVCTYPYYDYHAVQSLRREGKATWGDFVGTLIGAQQPVFRWTDPLPALSDVLRTMARHRIRFGGSPSTEERRRVPRSGRVGRS